MPLAQFVTDFADQAVLLPLVVAVAIGLVVMGWRRGALAWTVATTGVLGVMLVLKLGFAACELVLPYHGIRSPSGHTAAAGAIYGGLIALVVRRHAGASSAILAAFLVSALVGTTRVILGAHSLPEVIVGTVVGLVGMLVLLWLSGSPPALRWGRLIGVGAVLVAVFHGSHLGAEPVIDAVARYYFWPLSLCKMN